MVLAGLRTTKENGDCTGGKCSVIKGHMLKLDTTGTKKWAKDYGNYAGGINQFDKLAVGDWALIYNECWGVSPRYAADGTTQNGYLLACGTGIEGCTSMYGNDLLPKCKADPRTTWRALTIATDLNGERVWSRMDSFKGEDPKVASSAAEYVFPVKDGKQVIITDEAMGMGIMTIAKEDGKVCAKADVSKPPLPKEEEGASMIKYSTLGFAAALVGATLF